MAQVQLGKWFTRNNRLVMIDRSVEVEDSPSPGMPPQRRMVFEGIMFAADGKTEASRCTWEADGKYKTPSNVASQFDLVQLIEAAPAPTPVVEAPRDTLHILGPSGEPEGNMQRAKTLLIEEDKLIELLAPHALDPEATAAEVLHGIIEDCKLARPALEALFPHYDPAKDKDPHDTLNRLLDELKQLRQASAEAAQQKPGDPARENPALSTGVMIVPVPDQSGSGSTETVETQTQDGAAAELAGDK